MPEQKIPYDIKTNASFRKERVSENGKESAAEGLGTGRRTNRESKPPVKRRSTARNALGLISVSESEGNTGPPELMEEVGTE